LEVARTFASKGVELVSKLKDADGIMSLMKQYGNTEDPVSAIPGGTIAATAAVVDLSSNMID